VWLTRPERWGLILFAVVAVVFGGLVEMRSALLSRRMGDLSVFMRTAWAVRSGQDIYAVTDDNGFHYHYPPLLAILLVPLADPPVGTNAPWVLPYPVTVALCYVLNVLCLALAVHGLAGALEETSPEPAALGRPRFGRRWWALRILPVLTCLPPIGHTLMRGQVNLLLLLLVCGTIAATLRGRRFQAGLFLAGAICLKVIPALLVLHPLCRRDGRCLAGCAVGLVVGLGLIPAAVFGPAQTVAYYEEWADVLVRPGLGAGGDSARDKELIEVTATDSQSFQAALHNTLHPERATRPPHPSRAVRLVHWLVGGLLAALTLLAAWRCRDDRLATVITFGALVVVMVLTSPVCHLHYFTLSLPLVMGAAAIAWERGRRRLGVGMIAAAVVNIVANALPSFPGLELLRDDGLAMYAALLMWVVGMTLLWARRGPAVQSGRPPLSAAA
jgi:hypothetical protein